MINEGYCLCWNEWALDSRIKNELGLLLIISSLSAEQGYCWASNEYLSKLFNETPVNISRKISKLNKLGYVTIKYNYAGTSITSREIRPLTKMLTAINKNVNGTVNKNVKENNISIKNINNNISNRYFNENAIDYDELEAKLCLWIVKS